MLPRSPPRRSLAWPTQPETIAQAAEGPKPERNVLYVLNSWQLVSDGIVGDDHPAGAHRPDGMRCVRRYHGRSPGAEPCLPAVDHEDYLTFDDVPHLFLEVIVLVEVCRIRGDVPVGEGHVRRMEEPARPARKRRAMEHLAGVDERHAGRLRDHLPDVLLHSVRLLESRPAALMAARWRRPAP